MKATLDQVAVPATARQGRRKILVIVNVDQMVQAFLRPWLAAFQAAGYQVHVACRKGRYFSALAAEGFVMHDIPFQRTSNPFVNLAPAVKLLRLLRNDHFDAVTTHSPVGAAIGRVASWLAGARNVVYVVHGFYFHENTPPLLRRLIISIEQLLGKVTDHFAFVSEEDRRTALDSGIASSSSRTTTIHDGVDLDRFRPGPVAITDPVLERVDQARKSGSSVVGIVARLVKEKGYREFLAMTQSVIESGRDVIFLIVGRNLPTDRDQFGETLKRQVHEAGLDDRIIFAGFTPEIPDYLRAMDIFVLPSYREGLPRCVLEAMGVGLPVVATDIRGCREAIIHGETGLIVPPMDADALTEAVAYVLDHPEDADAMGLAGRRRAVELYDQVRVSERFVSVVERLIERRDGNRTELIGAGSQRTPISRTQARIHER